MLHFKHAELKEKLFYEQEGQLLLICTGSGKIVFSHGDCHLLQIKHNNLLHKNLFQLGFTLFSLISLQKTYPNGIFGDIMNKDSRMKFEMEYVGRTAIKLISQAQWKTERPFRLKKLQMWCSCIKVNFQKHKITHTLTDVLKESQISMLADSYDQQSLILVELSQAKNSTSFGTEFKDYEYTSRLIQQSERLIIGD